ncbi:hypothetical protein WJX72_004267 [[Myrmecia] bisecta]|uniref:Uncharacterized protein n=1 Tax=[Myrmecia] bisecta TaxID=41462 RepID=A0AAW1QF23_9CHLO
MQHLTFGNRKLEFCFERVADSRARQTSICIRGGLLAGWAAAFARMLALAEWAPNVRQTAVLTLCAATMLILAFGAAYLQWFVDARGSAEGTKCYLMVALGVVEGDACPYAVCAEQQAAVVCFGSLLDSLCTQDALLQGVAVAVMTTL